MRQLVERAASAPRCAAGQRGCARRLHGEAARSRAFAQRTELLRQPAASGRTRAGGTGRSRSKTIRLAGLLGVDRVVLMSGCPAGPGDANANWITTAWPPEAARVLRLAMGRGGDPVLEGLVAEAKSAGVTKLCLEMHGQQIVYNVATLFRLRDAVGPVVGANFDPSHLFWMGADPLAATRALATRSTTCTPRTRGSIRRRRSTACSTPCRRSGCSSAPGATSRSATATICCGGASSVRAAAGRLRRRAVDRARGPCCCRRWTACASRWSCCVRLFEAWPLTAAAVHRQAPP